MKIKQHTMHRWFFILAVLTIFIGLLAAVPLCKQTHLSMYTWMIADAYHETRHHLTVPGSQEVNLARTGAYGIYLEQNLFSSTDPEVEMPPVIDCTLTSKSTRLVIEAVPDYVKTNQYKSRNLQTGVLIMSVTIDTPGTYTFKCDYQDGRTDPEIVVALGPNYFWEFIRAVWKIGLPVLSGSTILCGSGLLAILLLVTGIIIKVINATKFAT